MIDYLIIGSGLAGIAFAQTALENGKSVLIIDSDVMSSSKVAAGLYNPVILKRFTSVWNAKQQLDELDLFTV
jgi:glycine oxidase